jgi:hypothetical protein
MEGEGLLGNILEALLDGKFISVEIMFSCGKEVYIGGSKFLGTWQLCFLGWYHSN